MAGTSDYGATITKGGVTVGKCIVVDWPELATAKINTTHHGSGGWSEGIPSGLIEAGDITLMVLLEDGMLETVITEMLAKTVSTVVLSDTINTFTFSGFYLSAKKEAADAQSPNAVRASVVISPTGVITPS